MTLNPALLCWILVCVGVTKAQINWGNNNWALNCDFPGEDFANQATTSDQCGGVCAAKSSCTHFTWTSYNGGTCWLKFGPVVKSDAVYLQGGVCGLMTSTITWQANNWAFGCDFIGHDMSSVVISSSQCGGQCASTSGCTHFTWTTFNGGTCWMKSGAVTQGDAIATGDTTMVCGVVSSSSVTTTMPGTTTRYWDCCKPSCAWPGKANTNGVVETCDKSGATVLTDLNAASGCGGGPAYTCNDNIPYAVNSNLAYGFAAANIKGISEADWCCACYQLDFTNTAVAGKTLVVMVTNTGADLGTNHFDLQIPGSGVGLFDGCTSQWGLPTSVWGQTYGGVSSRTACDALPQPIRAGCQWRFDWFLGADNPSMNFKNVACPADLQSKARCSRKS